MGLADVAQMAAVLREVWIDHGASMDGFSNGLSIMLLLVVAHLYMRHVFCFIHMAAFLVDVAAFSDMFHRSCHYNVFCRLESLKSGGTTPWCVTMMWRSGLRPRTPMRLAESELARSMRSVSLS